MAPNCGIQTGILRPVADVFDAIVSSDRLCKYFTDESSGDLRQGAEVRWRWDHYHAVLPVFVEMQLLNLLASNSGVGVFFFAGASLTL